MSWPTTKAEWREADLARHAAMARLGAQQAPDAGPLIATGSGWPIRRRGDATGEPRRTLLGNANEGAGRLPIACAGVEFGSGQLERDRSHPRALSSSGSGVRPPVPDRYLSSHAGLHPDHPPGRQHQGRADRHPRRRLRQGVHRPWPGQGRRPRALQRQARWTSAARSTENGKLEIFTAKTPEALEIIRHDAAHVVATPCSGSSRAPRSPSARRSRTASTTTSSATGRSRPRTSRRSRTRPTRRSPQNLPFVRRRSPPTRRSALRVQGREVQGRDHRGHRRQGRQDADALPARRLGRLLPRAPRSVDREDRRHQAALVQRRLLARRSPQPDAPAHLRHRLLRQEGARRLAEAAGGGEEARPPQARQGAGPVRVPPRRAGRGVLDARRAPSLYHGARGPDAPADARRTATQEIKTPLLYNKALWEKSAATGASTARTCSWCSTTRPASTTSRSSR